MDYCLAALVVTVWEMLAQCGLACPASQPSVVRAVGGDDVGLKGAAPYWAEYRAR